MITFDALTRQYSGMLYRHIYRMVGNAEDAQDLLQEVLLLIYRKLHTYKGDASLKNWLYRIASNRTIDFLRRKARRPETDIPEDLASSADPLSFTRRLQTRSRLAEALATLSEEYRQIVIMKEIDGFTFREIATILDIPENTAKTRLYASLRKLKEHLEQKNGEVCS